MDKGVCGCKLYDSESRRSTKNGVQKGPKSNSPATLTQLFKVCVMAF